MPDFVELVPQDKSNACWLASATMMRSWKDSRSYPLSDTLMVLDGPWGIFYQAYNADKGLSFSDNSKIVETLGLTALPPASYIIDYFFTLLDVSPIMAVIMFSDSSNIAHMIVITSISGDRTPDGTFLQINDPLPIDSGHTYSISFADFLNKFEAVVSYENKFGVTNLTSQLFYYAPVNNPFTDAANGSADASGNSSGNTADPQPDTDSGDGGMDPSDSDPGNADVPSDNTPEDDGTNG